MKYNSHLNYKKRKRFIFTVRLLIVVFLVFIVAGSAYVYFKYFSEDSSQNQTAITAPKTTTIASTISVYRTPYFQFQGRNSWAEVENLSGNDKYVYRNIKSNLIQAELTIYLRQIPANIEANRVIPVTFNTEKSRITPESVSDHCVKALNNKSSIQAETVVVSGVKMLCDSDSVNYDVLVGEVGGDTVLNMIRPDGTPIVYAIYYNDLTASPNTNELMEILSSFQTR